MQGVTHRAPVLTIPTRELFCPLRQEFLAGKATVSLYLDPRIDLLSSIRLPSGPRLGVDLTPWIEAEADERAMNLRARPLPEPSWLYSTEVELGGAALPG